jgi:hypothetical protein
MTNPGDSDEWWKQYGGEGVPSESGGHASVPPPPPAPYGSNPQNPAQPMTPPGQPFPSYPQPAPQPQPYGQPAGFGQPAPGYQPYGYAQPRTSNGLAIASLVTSIAGLFTCGVSSIVGIILGIVSLNQIKQRNQDGRGLALAGIWIGVAFIVLWIAYWVFVVIMAAHSSSTS